MLNFIVDFKPSLMYVHEGSDLNMYFISSRLAFWRIVLRCNNVAREIWIFAALYAWNIESIWDYIVVEFVENCKLLADNTDFHPIATASYLW